MIKDMHILIIIKEALEITKRLNSKEIDKFKITTFDFSKEILNEYLNLNFIIITSGMYPITQNHFLSRFLPQIFSILENFSKTSK
jgi:hypothetical protein